MVFSLVWEVFQYNLVKHNELPKDRFRVSNSCASSLSKLSLFLISLCGQRNKVDIFMMRTNCFLELSLPLCLTLAIHWFVAEASAMSSN